MSVTCRTATADEVALMLDWAASEGWNPGRDDAAAFRTADPEGFFVAEADDAPVAAISVVNHDDAFAFLGLYLCRPEFRGRGIGYALWQHALAHAGARTVGLDGVADQQANYARSGFALTGATARLEGPMPALPARPTRPLLPEDLETAQALDLAANGYARTAFLDTWLPPAATRITMVTEGPAGITGFATARTCRAGCKIGPVVAPDLDTALTLIASAAGIAGAEPVIVDVPDSQPALADALREQGFVETFATARMYRGTPPAPDGTLFAVATLELG
ncbi:acetyltransferase [Oceanicola sp. 22II-s10i]|uniref:GNAT family N-acetyltransferase n=1 Tax=Oceanicola sp. 22II-s10i TaxID=1317116 RepID=UPI000B52370A|nr:GNAT family N-acetyltransferase [Oceanicola sp. 22II-s10i]OWU84991.1 acetyltransferase [Oceanicola sp. 22II-s10i]